MGLEKILDFLKGPIKRKLWKTIKQLMNNNGYRLKILTGTNK